MRREGTVVRVKICGITNLEDALLAVEAGADALGFVFAPSPRRVTPQEAGRICRELPPFVVRVGVFVDAPLEEVRAVAESCGLDAVQLHGSEPPEYCRKVGRRVIKALRVRESLDTASLAAYPVQAFLLDSYDAARPGGTGRSFDWGLVRDLRFPRPFILAGGLTPANVARAVALLRPYGVDVSSGVEREGQPGKKDPQKVKLFIAEAKKAVL